MGMTAHAPEDRCHGVLVDVPVEVEQWWFGIQGDPSRQRHLYRDREAATAAAEAHHAKSGDYVIVGFTRAGVETAVLTIPGLLSDAPRPRGV
jgi:hypothetical protein